ncbi:hypothetical protein NW733_03170 [Mycoplasmopsis felis]|uniref:hypothetical protein n=1 Tax=Mycoplasmopsis felis TaxID=33923 RepID=UPI0021E0BE61|nr:hypothetical protein [Mycoplasmopsis felis]MCU9931680.1 hypothetical protein [Mycoplasmopsis felis]
MSKSEKSSEKSVIYLLEDPNSAYNKIIKSVTDSENKVYISENKPVDFKLIKYLCSFKWFITKRNRK